MTKQEFLEGKEFKTLASSAFTYKKMGSSIGCSYRGQDFKFESGIDEITEDGFESSAAILGEIFRVKLEFKNLI